MGKLISIFVDYMEFKFCGPNNAKFDTEQNMCEKSMSYYIYIYIYMYPRLPQHFLRKHGVSLRTNIGKKYAIKSRKNPLMICEEINREGQEKSTGAMDEYIEDDIHPHHEGHISEKIIENAEETIKEPKSTPVEDRKGQNTVSIEIEADDTRETSPKRGDTTTTNQSVYFTPPERNFTKEASTQTFPVEENVILQTDSLVEDFKLWLTTMDGGCYNDETSKKAYLFVKSMLKKLSLAEMLDSTIVCEFFTKEEAMGVCAASLGVYLRYYSSFLFYFHDKNRHYFLYE